jgi:outer membrane murein-binding lipoprotein Lpp
MILQYTRKLFEQMKTNLKTLLSKYAPQFEKAGLVVMAKEDGTTKIEMMSEASLQDGTKIYTNDSEWKVGSEVFVMDENNNPVPIDKDGEMLLEDGTTIIIAGGKVTEMKKKEEDEMSAVTKEEFEAVIGSLIEAFEKKFDALSKEKQELSAKVTELSKKPATQSARAQTAQSTQAKETSEPAKDWSRMTLLERIQNGLTEK